MLISNLAWLETEDEMCVTGTYGGRDWIIPPGCSKYNVCKAALENGQTEVEYE